MVRRDIDEARDAIERQLESGVPRNVICASFGCKPVTLNRRLTAWGLGHLHNQPGRDRPKSRPRRPLLLSLTEQSTVSTYKLKLRLWNEGLKPKHCEECGWARQSEGGRLPLELHHINGDSFDNRIENLAVLCPNCHSLKSNHRGLNQVRRRGKMHEAVKLR